MRLASIGTLAVASIVGSAACGGEVGTVTVDLVTAPGSTVLDAAETLRLTITSPHQVYEASRGADGFKLDIAFDANGENGAMIVDALDANGATVATGQSPPFPVAAINAHIVVYMAAPTSIAEAPQKLSARSELAVGALSYGVVFAGGLDAAGAASDRLEVYNSYDHSLTPGLAMPAPRRAPAMAVLGTAVYLFGGRDATGTGTDTLTLWRFDTNVAPAGQYIDLTQTWPMEFARSGQLAAQLDASHFAISGTPVLELDAAAGTLVAYPGTPMLPPVGVTVTAPDQITTAVFAGTGAGSSGVIQLRGEDAIEVAGQTPRTGHAIAGINDGKVVIVGGGDGATLSADLIVIAPGTTPKVDPETHPDPLLTPRSDPAVAASHELLLVAGGTAMDGSLVGNAELFDTINLRHVTTLPLLVPRTRATAIALPNHQIMIVGGIDAAGAPIDTIELFTPQPASE